MGIHVLSPAHVIARNWSLERIDDERAKIHRSLQSALARQERYAEAIQKRKSTATVALLERKYANLNYARWLWIDDYRKTEKGIYDES